MVIVNHTIVIRTKEGSTPLGIQHGLVPVSALRSQRDEHGHLVSAKHAQRAPLPEFSEYVVEGEVCATKRPGSREPVLSITDITDNSFSNMVSADSIPAGGIEMLIPGTDGKGYRRCRIEKQEEKKK